VNPPNESLKGSRHNTPRAAGSTGPGASPPDHRFNHATAPHLRPPPSAEPSEPMVPVQPFDDKGLPNQARKLPDEAMPLREAKR